MVGGGRSPDLVKPLSRAIGTPGPGRTSPPTGQEVGRPKATVVTGYLIVDDSLHLKVKGQKMSGLGRLLLKHRGSGVDWALLVQWLVRALGAALSVAAMVVSVQSGL